MVSLVLAVALMVSPVKMEKLLRDYLMESYQWQDVQVRVLDLKGRPMKALPEEITLIKGPLGRAVFVLKYPGDRKVEVTAMVRAKVKVLVATSPIRKGQVLRSEQVGQRLVDVQRMPSDGVMDFESIRGLKARFNIRAGTVLRMGMFQRPFTYKRGQKVTVLYQKGALRITSTGILREDAREGMLVRVLNLATNKLLRGVLQKGGIVDVTP